MQSRHFVAMASRYNARVIVPIPEIGERRLKRLDELAVIAIQEPVPNQDSHHTGNCAAGVRSASKKGSKDFADQKLLDKGSKKPGIPDRCSPFSYFPDLSELSAQTVVGCLLCCRSN
jgi:hypothetical protein